MKTLGRILIITVVFVLVVGIVYTVVNSSNSSRSFSALERGEGTFPRPEGMQSRLPEGERPDFDRNGPGGGAWLFGLVKNIGILAIIVVLIVLPKSLIRSIRRKVIPAQN